MRARRSVPEQVVEAFVVRQSLLLLGAREPGTDPGLRSELRSQLLLGDAHWSKALFGRAAALGIRGRPLVTRLYILHLLENHAVILAIVLVESDSLCELVPRCARSSLHPGSRFHGARLHRRLSFFRVL
jgi:hypothetical protein